MAKWAQLIAARERKHLSQLETAERVNVGLVTYQRWEAGTTKPQPQHMRHLEAVFDTLFDRFDALRSHTTPAHATGADPSSVSTISSDSPEEMPFTVPVVECDEPLAFIATHMTTHLWSLAFKPYSTSKDRRDTIRQAIKEFDTMDTTNKNYQITRREALCSLATLPMITFGLTLPGKTVPPAHYGSVLAQCAASVEACWELFYSGDASDTALAFKSVSKYLSVLQAISKDSSPYRKEALDLATRYALKNKREEESEHKKKKFEN